MNDKKVVAVVYKGEDILIGKKKDISNHFLSGKWHIPGETIKPPETDEQALIRGIKEEANILIRVEDYIGSSRTPTKKIANWYECYYISGNLKAGSDLDEVKWVPKRQALTHCDKEAVSLWPKRLIDYFNY